MSAIFAWPAQLKWSDPGVALTLIVPAIACNLSCSFCAIRQRKEIAEVALRPEDYATFIKDVAACEPTAMVSIQGFEPLLPEAWPYTSAVLAAAREAGVTSSLVTNGLLLEERAADLVALEPAGITVSIDSAVGQQHDRLRGRKGALEKTVAGIRALSKFPGYCERITVSSVLLPRRRRFLEGMPKLLATLGVTQWAVSPLLRIRNGVGGPVAPSDMILDDVLALHELAAAEGVELILDDELGCLEARSEHYQQFLIRRFERPDGLARLTPSGACSIGSEILAEVDDQTPVWRPGKEGPAAFLLRVRDGRRQRQLRAAA